VLDRRNNFLTAGATDLAVTLAFRRNLLAQLEDAPSGVPDRSFFDKNEKVFEKNMAHSFRLGRQAMGGYLSLV
jgi:hypothetical protein